MNKEDLTSEEKEVNRLINESKTKIDSLQKKIDELPRDRGYDARYNMAGGPQAHDPGASAKARQEALGAIEKEKNQLAEKVDHTLSGSSQEVRENGQKNLTSYLYPEKITDKEKAVQKDMTASQGFAMKLRYGEKKDGPLTPEHERAKQKDLSASQEFAMKLRHDAVAKNEKATPDKTDQAKEEQSKPMSMSMQFSQKLKSTEMEKAEAEPQKEESVNKQPTIDKEKERE